MIRVLIVEDDPMVAEFNKLYLEQIEGFTLIGSVKSTVEACTIVHNQQIELILLDVFMPGVDGLTFLSELRKKEKEIDVIVISAANDTASIEKALRNGAYDYLIKPFSFERFQEALTKYRNGKKQLQKNRSWSQKELDQILFHTNRQGQDRQHIPKGLTKSTLQAVWNLVLQIKDRPFTTEELCSLSGISRVSIRKYLSFLHEIGTIEEVVVYGSVGRPYYTYQLINTKTHLIQHYL